MQESKRYSKFFHSYHLIPLNLSLEYIIDTSSSILWYMPLDCNALFHPHIMWILHFHYFPLSETVFLLSFSCTIMRNLLSCAILITKADLSFDYEHSFLFDLYILILLCVSIFLHSVDKVSISTHLLQNKKTGQFYCSLMFS